MAQPTMNELYQKATSDLHYQESIDFNTYLMGFLLQSIDSRNAGVGSTRRGIKSARIFATRRRVEA